MNNHTKRPSGADGYRGLDVEIFGDDLLACLIGGLLGGLANGPHKVAVTGGEHSGNTASFMRYRIADKLLVREGCAAIGVVQRTYYQTSKSACDRLLPYVGGTEYRVTDLFADGPIAEEQFQFVPGPGGTGVNAGGRGAGSACRDGDLPQLNVRSPS